MRKLFNRSIGIDGKDWIKKLIEFELSNDKKKKRIAAKLTRERIIDKRIDAKAMNILIKSVKNQDIYYATIAIYLLARVKNDKSIEILVDILDEDSDINKKIVAAKALRYKNQDIRVIMSLSNALDSNISELRYTAKESLDKIMAK